MNRRVAIHQLAKCILPVGTHQSYVLLSILFNDESRRGEIAAMDFLFRSLRGHFLPASGSFQSTVDMDVVTAVTVVPCVLHSVTHSNAESLANCVQQRYKVSKIRTDYLQKMLLVSSYVHTAVVSPPFDTVFPGVWSSQILWHTTSSLHPLQTTG